LTPPKPVPGLQVLQVLLLVAELMIAIAMVILILLQRSEGGALGMGGGGSGLGGLFSPRGAADTLTRTTAILAALFFATCILLNILALGGRDEHSILDSSPTANQPAQSTTKPANSGHVPQVPLVPTPH
jgi:preprotein translocase subunit SecG